MEFLNNGKAHVKVEMNADDLMAVSEKALLIYCKFKWIMQVCRFRFRIGGRRRHKRGFCNIAQISECM